jgi:hypothetical protein
VRRVVLLLALCGCDGVFGIRYIDGKPDAPVADVLPPVDVGPDGGSTTYAAEVLADGPVGYFRLGETSGVTAKNLVPGGPDGTYIGTFMLGASGAVPGDDALALDYANAGAVDVGNNYAFPGAAPFSIEAWVKPAPDDGHSHIIASKWHQPTTNVGYELFVQGTAVKFSRELPASSDLVTADGLVADQYAHVVATFDGAMLRLYLNGTQRAIGSSVVQLPVESNPFQIGEGNGFATFSGSIDEVAIYDKALSAGRVNAHYVAAQTD